MDDINILVAIAMLMAGIFGMTGLRLYFITHQDVNMSKKINGLSIDMGKVKKQLRDGSVGVVRQTTSMADMVDDAADMNIDQFVEMMGFDPKELNNPIVRPIAEKIFNQFKAKAGDTDTQEQNIPSDL